MNFIEYTSNLFANLSNAVQEILVADEYVLIANSLVVCNTTNKNIRFNLKKVRNQGTAIEIFLINEFEIEAFQTIDVLKELGITLFLQYDINPMLSDSLQCFSNGYSQKFDLEISYSRLHELPIN